MPKIITTRQYLSPPNYVCQPDGLAVRRPVIPDFIVPEEPKKEKQVHSNTWSFNPRCNRAVRLAEREWDPQKEYETRGENRGDDIIKYRYGVDNDFAWCASFFNYLYNPNHKDGQNVFGMEDKDVISTQKMLKRAKEVGCFAPANSNYKLQVGDGLVWKSNVDDMKGHIGIIVEVRDDGSFVTIQGNSNDKIEKIEYSSIEDAMVRAGVSGSKQILQGFLQMSKYNEKHHLTDNGSGNKNSDYCWVA